MCWISICKIYSICLFVYMPVCLFVYPINVKMTELIGPKFCLGPQVWPKGRFMDAQNFKNLFNFLLFLSFENPRTNIIKSANFLGLFFILYKENFRSFLNKSQPYSLALELYHFLLNIFRQKLWHHQELVL